MDINLFLDLIFPSVCVNCKKRTKERSPVCEECFRKIKINSTFFCGQCRARLPEAKKICHKDTSFILGAAGEYKDEVLRNLIHALKFEGVKSCAIPLAGLLKIYLEPLISSDFIIVPVPLGKQRRRTRGYNQTELIAEPLAESLGLDMDKKLLARIKETKPQSELKGAEERFRNTSGCFGILSPERVRNKNFLILDDVVTSGSTLLEAATILKTAGAGKILGIAAAKA